MALALLLALCGTAPPAAGRSVPPGSGKAAEQKERKFTIRVTVLNTKQEPVRSAVVLVEPYGVWGITGDDGTTEVRAIPYDPSAVYHIAVSILGYKPYATRLRPLPDRVNEVEARIEEESIAMKEVVVVAENSKSGESTASKIGRQAIDHLQATSLKDLLQLLPGQVSMSNPSLTGAGYFKVRTLNNPNNNNSFGSSILVDGIPVSTNADMGVSLSSVGAGDNGVDLRSIGADDIESVEVIRGIASAEYGDVSSGTMIVNSKIGVTDLNIKGKIMPGITQFYAGKGFDAGRAGNINLSADYAHGKSDPRFRTDTYDRILFSAAHSKNLAGGKWILTTKLNFTTVREWSGADPDEPEALQKYYRQRKGYNLRISHSGKINLNRLFARTIRYDLAYTNNTDRVHSEDLVAVGGGAILDALSEGMHVGNPYPTSYETIVGTKSNPVSYYAKISDVFQLNAGKFRNRFNIGAEFRSEGNEGIGRYDLSKEYPAFAAGRVRRFCDLPYLTQVSAYAEDNFNFAPGKNAFPNIKGQVGVRWTMIQPGRSEQKHTFSPRINLSVNPAEWLSIRGGFGISEKMPSLLMLYPQFDYYDFYNMSVSNGQDRYYLYSTRIFDPANRALKPMRNTKWEAGFDLKLPNGMVFSVVGYSETIRNGFGYDNSRWTALTFDRWEASDVRFEGKTPVYDPQRPTRVDTVLYNVSRPANVGVQINRGLEFDFNLGKIRATNTAFYLNGAWTTTQYHSARKTYTIPTGATKTYSNVYVVYPEGASSKTEMRQVSAALRIVQHIPSINFIVSATAQFIFHDYDYAVNIADKPVGYLIAGRGAYPDGRGGVDYVSFTPEQLADPEFRFEGYMLKDQQYRQVVSNLPVTWPTIWCLNLRVTKEINDIFGFSFYANNVLFHQPWQTSSTSSNPVERNSSLFSYGLEMFVHF